MINRILNCDFMDGIQMLPENCIDAVITDPPYHLTSSSKSKGFMGNSWDGGDISFNRETWVECFRVLKPGSYLVSFGGTRTFDKMVAAIRESGFEIVDMMCWLYGTGFPKAKGVLKPGFEPICVARKPRVDGYTAQTLLIDSSKINGDKWPTNVVIDGESASLLDSSVRKNEEPSRFFYCAKASRKERDIFLDDYPEVVCGGLSGRTDGTLGKTSVGKNDHNTVKPIKLMEYLVKLVCPENSVVLDPFAGSGTTGHACLTTNRSFILMEKSTHYSEMSYKKSLGYSREFACNRTILYTQL